jgi:hypothetical protein
LAEQILDGVVADIDLNCDPPDELAPRLPETI